MGLKTAFAASALVLIWGSGPAALAADRYTAADFTHVDKIDAHVHLNGPAEQFMQQAERDGVRVLTINVDYPDFPPLALQETEALKLHARYPGRVAFATTFAVANFQAPDWAATQIRHIDAAIAKGAVGVKVWKNIGLALQDPDGKYVMLDDARFKPIFDHLEQDHIVLLGHQAEPLNCWLPLDKMTVGSDREYFTQHPQYYMYRHPEVPNHEAQLAARDRMLKQHPQLRFDSVHLASLEWDVDKIAAFLEQFPRATVDMAARMSHLEHQATRDREKVRQFLLRYQDRVLYGTDMEVGPNDTSAKVATDAHDTWLDDWKFLTSAGQLHSTEFDAPYQGLDLPKAVVDKIYSGNARRVFPGAWTSVGQP